MEQQTIEYGVRILKRSIRYYKRTINHQKSGKARKFKNYEANMEKNKIILADLKAIMKAIQKNETAVTIQVTVEKCGYMYPETCRVVEKAGFEIDGDGWTNQINLWPEREWKRAWEQEEDEEDMY